MKFGGRGGASTLSAWCALLVPCAALGQAELRIHVDVRSCGELPQPEIRRVLAAELNARLAEERSSDVTRIVIECQGARAVLRVGDPLSRKVVQRSIDLGSSDPLARGRLVALATAELVVASWSELESNPTPKVEPAGPRPPPTATAAARKVARQRGAVPTVITPVSPAEVPPAEAKPPAAEKQPPYERRWPDPHDWGVDEPSPDLGFRVVGMFSSRTFFSHEGTLWGGGVRIGEERFKTVGWTLDTFVESGEVETSAARFQVDTATLGAGIHLYQRWNWFIGRVGTGVRMGLARTQPLDSQLGANAALAPWGWPLASLGFSMRARRLVLEMVGEASYVVLPVGAGSTPVKGAWFGVQAGLGVLP